MASSDLLAQREKIRRQIEALERLVDAGDLSENVDISSSDSSPSDDDSSEDDDQEPVSAENINMKREQIQREIKELELSLSQDTPGFDVGTSSPAGKNDSGTSGEDSNDGFSLPPNVETCLQLNLVYQDVLEEKLTELERLLVENKEQQKEVMVQVSGSAPQATTSGLPPLRLFLGNFMKPYFKDKVTGLGPPANSETRDKMNMGARSYDDMRVRKWEGWQKNLLLTCITSDTMKRMLQPKMSKLEYLIEKKANIENPESMEKQILQKQINQIEREIEEISSMSEEQLMGGRHDDHDWEKISNIDFEGTRSAEDIRRFWENYLHPSVNKSSWDEDEIKRLRDIVENRTYCNWDQIAQELGTNRTAFMCLQANQRYIYKDLKKRHWTKAEDRLFRELVGKMRIGNYIPYTQISYFMEGREPSQLVYRWTQVLDPTVKKGHWSKEEDEMLLKAVKKFGVRDWWKIRSEVPSRTDAQCRERYLDVLSGNAKKGRWSPEEEAMLIDLVQKHGVGRWAKISAELGTRHDSQCLQKWHILTGSRIGERARKRRKYPPIQKTVKRRRVVKVKREEDTSSSSEEEVVYVTSSDEELTKDESELEIDLREEYILPFMEKWIPKTPDSFPHFGLSASQSVASKLAHKRASLSRATLGRPCSVNSFLTVSPEVRCTILDRIGCPVSTNMASSGKPLLQGHHSENDMIQVSLGEVRNLLCWDGSSKVKLSRCRLSVKTLKASRTEAKARNKTVGVTSVAHPTRMSVSSHVCTRHCTTLKDELLLAITPWMGHLILPLAGKKYERCKLDVVGERSKTIVLTSTPVFSLLLRILSVDALGCKNVIEARTKTEIRLPHQKAVTPPRKTSNLPPKTGALSAPPSNRTANQMLIEKRKLECLKKADQKQSGLVMMMPQPLVITQPPLQEIEPPVAAASSAPDQTAIAKAVETDSVPKTAQPRKRTRKPTEKAKVLLDDSKEKLPKKSRSGKRRPVGKKISPVDVKISPVPLCPQPAITWILLPNGLLPVSGLGIPASAQAPSVEMKSVSSNVSGVQGLNPIDIKSNNSLTFPMNGAPTTSLGGAIAFNLVPTPSASKDTLAGKVTCGNTSVPSLSSVGVPNFNTAPAQLPVHFVAAEPGSTVMPVPASVKAGMSVADSTSSVAGVPPLNPQLTYMQGLPVLQVCQPQTSQVNVNTSVNPVIAPTKTTPQQQVFGGQKKLAPSPTLPKSPRPEPAPGFDVGLVSAEETSLVTEWTKGVGGIKLAGLDATLPYLPPFVSNLSTLTALLKCKASLEKSALPLVSPDGESAGAEFPEKDVRRLVAERLGGNKAYLLLKARFLSCFSLPAFLATVHPQENADDADDSPSSPAKYSKDEDSESSEEDVDPGGSEVEGVRSGDEGVPGDQERGRMGDLLRTDGMGRPANEFSGIATQHPIPPQPAETV